MNYFAWHLCRLIYAIDYTENARKEKVVLLGDGFFARGFLHTIDSTRYSITQVYREPFVNPQCFDFNYRLKDLLLPRRKIFIEEIKPESLKFKEQAVLIKGSQIHYDHLVIGLGAQKPLRAWQEVPEHTVVVGMGPTGIEMATKLAEKGIKVQLYEALPEERAMPYLSPEGKQIVLKSLKNLNITMKFGEKYNGSALLCVGTQANVLTANLKITPQFAVMGDPRVHVGGDGANLMLIKSGQMAYQQGVYVAQKLNGQTGEDFKYVNQGLAIKIGQGKIFVEGHRWLPTGVYPEFLLRVYSFFFV
jgi:NADH dehydrogenase FAD-containing subunit